MPTLMRTLRRHVVPEARQRILKMMNRQVQRHNTEMKQMLIMLNHTPFRIDTMSHCELSTTSRHAEPQPQEGWEVVCVLALKI